MLKNLTTWITSKLFAEVAPAGPRAIIETTDRHTCITLNLAGASIDCPAAQNDQAALRLVSALRKTVTQWANREKWIERHANDSTDYTGDDYPRDGCELTITVRESGSFGVSIQTPDGRFIESWPCDTPEQLGLRVARWAAGKEPIHRPGPSAAHLESVRDFVQLKKFNIEDFRRACSSALPGLDLAEAQIAPSKGDQGIAGQV